MTELSPEILEAINNASRAGVEKGIETAFTKMGFDTKNPVEAQKNNAFLTKQRQASERITLAVRLMVYGSVVTGAISLLVVGIKSALHIT